MSRKELRIRNTELDNLVSNLRAEVGDVIFTWTLMRDLLVEVKLRREQDGVDPISDPQLNTLRALAGKLEDDIVARLSELGESKVGRLTFYFASQKLSSFSSDVREYQKYVKAARFTEKRNADISHKELPEKWPDHRHIHVSYESIVHGIVMALRLMKEIDSEAVGPEATFFWRKLRERRYERQLPAKAQYMIGPYIKLSIDERISVMNAELQQGKVVWERMETNLNGQPATLWACKKWGAVVLGSRVLLLDQYPLINLTSIQTDVEDPKQDGSSNA